MDFKTHFLRLEFNLFLGGRKHHVRLKIKEKFDKLRCRTGGPGGLPPELALGKLR